MTSFVFDSHIKPSLCHNATSSFLCLRRTPMSELEQRFKQELQDCRWNEQIHWMRLFSTTSKSGRPDLPTIKTTWMRCIFQQVESSARLFHHLNEYSTLELSAIQGLAKALLGHFLTDSPMELEDALQRQDLPVSVPPGQDRLMLELLLPFTDEDVMGVIRRSVLLHENPRLNWNHLSYLISKFLQWVDGAESLLEDFISTQLTESITLQHFPKFQAILFVARAACASKSGLFANYRYWCQRTWKPTSQSWMVQPEKWSIFVDFLTRMVPYERAVCLTAHIAVQASHSLSIPSMRALWADYCNLARTRLSDFQGSTSLHPTGEDHQTIIFQQALLGTESLSEVMNDVSKALEEFQAQGQKIPQKVLEASIFRKAYFQGQFLPCLLSDEFRGPGKSVFIEELVKKGKIPRKLLNQ